MDLPTKYESDSNWLVWKDHVLSDINVGTNCIDTTSGVCFSDKSIDECIEICASSKDCAAGLHSVLPNGKSLCLPLDTGRRSHLNPIVRIEPQTNPRLGEVSVFMDTRVFPFPPVNGRALRYTDMISIILPDGSSIYPSTKGNVTTEKTDPPSVVQMLPPWGTIQSQTRLAFLVYGKPIHISPPGTGLTALSDDGKWIWSPASVRFEDTEGIVVLPVGSKKIGEPVMSGDTVRLQKDGEYLGVSPSHKLISSIRPDPDTQTVFKLESRMVGYMCGEGLCEAVSIMDTKPNQKVYRHSGCYNQCSSASTTEAEDNKRNNIIPIILIVATAVVSIVLIIMFLRR